MGLEIDKYNGRNIPQEMIDVYKIKNEMNEEVRKAAEKKTAKADEKKNQDVKVDSYNKNLVSNTIEQQIKEQEAKIKEINENLEGLRKEYYETGDAEDAARTERYLKSRELYQKEISERSLKRLFNSWRMKYLKDKTDEAVEREYNLSNLDYDSAIEERILADKNYNISDSEAFSAIMKHNKADAAFLGGLWRKQDAYWDLAKMHQRLGIAKMQESRFNK